MTGIYCAGPGGNDGFGDSVDGGIVGKASSTIGRAIELVLVLVELVLVIMLMLLSPERQNWCLKKCWSEGVGAGADEICQVLLVVKVHQHQVERSVHQSHLVVSAPPSVSRV